MIYVPIPKAANGSVKQALAEKTGKNFRLSAHKYKWDLIELSKVSKSSYFSFTIVRNPLFRLLSCYIQKTIIKDPFLNFWKYGNLIFQNMSFEEFVDFVVNTPDYLADRHFKSQHTFLYLNNKVIVDYVGKIETLQLDWEYLSKKLDFPPIQHLNKSNEVKFLNLYNKEIANKVKQRYSKDIELFGYEKEVEDFIQSIS